MTLIRKLQQGTSAPTVIPAGDGPHEVDSDAGVRGLLSGILPPNHSGPCESTQSGSATTLWEKARALGRAAKCKAKAAAAIAGLASAIVAAVKFTGTGADAEAEMDAWGESDKETTISPLQTYMDLVVEAQWDFAYEKARRMRVGKRPRSCVASPPAMAAPPWPPRHGRPAMAAPPRLPRHGCPALAPLRSHPAPPRRASRTAAWPRRRLVPSPSLQLHRDSI